MAVEGGVADDFGVEVGKQVLVGEGLDGARFGVEETAAKFVGEAGTILHGSGVELVFLL